MEVGEVGGEAGAEHGVAALTVQDLVQLGLREPNLQQAISGKYQGSTSSRAETIRDIYSLS